MLSYSAQAYVFSQVDLVHWMNFLNFNFDSDEKNASIYSNGLYRQ